jgi:hypothetical protein|eukprot:TRINITY_DN1215_c0_g1_i1.p1 TRINITY_DN1215_c0_g1~~TRINITY_DN1215_c0_g1_i1.p1  ORF type:complete len:218 (-),score=60.08 TRINITY_DN1215_c0_g1_i1:446-1099(-)
MVEEEEHQIVIAALDAMTVLLKQCKNAVTEGAGHCEKIVSCIQMIMKGECAARTWRRRRAGWRSRLSRTRCCLSMLEKSCPTLAFASYFVLHRAAANPAQEDQETETSFAIGAIADSIKPLARVLDPFLPHLLPIFVEMTRDAEDDCRNNAVCGLGEVILWGGQVVEQVVEQHYTAVLGTLSQLLQLETSPRVVDSIVGPWPGLRLPTLPRSQWRRW